jgi:hypothetical protein
LYYAAQDILEYLMASVGGGAQEAEHRALRIATHNALRDVGNARDWRWYETEAPLPAPTDSTNKVYILPANVKNVDSVVPPDRTTITEFVNPREWRRLEIYTLPTPSPLYWTVMRSPTKPDRWQMMFAGNPSGIDPSLTYYFTYRRQPTPLRYMGYEEVCRDGSLTATTAPGAVKRYGTAANFPEGMAGTRPFTAQEILGVAGSLQGTPPSGAKTVVSDYLDMSDHMYTAVLSGADMWLARLLGKNIDGATAVFQRDMRLAMEADQITPISGQRSFGALYSPRAMGYYSPTQANTGV